MKIFFQLVILFSSFYYLQAQTITTFQEVGEPETQKLVNKYSCFFRTMEDQDRLFRIGLTSFSRGPGSWNSSRFIFRGIEMAVEQKIRSGLSLTYASSIQQNHFTNEIDHSDSEYPRWGQNDMVNFRNELEVRFYPSKRKRIKAGLSGNNLAGWYVGLKSEVDFWKVLTTENIYHTELIPLDISSRITGRNVSILLNLGWQQKFGKNGFVNFNVGTGKMWQSKNLNLLEYDDNGALLSTPFSNWLVDYQVTFGYAFGSKKPYSNSDCTILQYFEKEQSMWKIDLLNAINAITNNFIRGSLSVEFEQKLGRFPLSISAEARNRYAQGLNKNSLGLSSFIIGAELRHYYNLKRRIHKGKTGNNLCADYIGIGINQNFYHSFASRIKGVGRTVSSFKWGAQRRVFEKLYFDFSVNYAVHSSNQKVTQVFDLDNFYSRLKIGFAF